VTLTGDGLPRLLDDLRDLTPPEDLPVLDELSRRLSEPVLRVLVAGEAKRGKSTCSTRCSDAMSYPLGSCR
jgi:hypothetical protein